MSKREAYVWYVVYGITAAYGGAMCWYEASLNRFFEGGVVLLMTVGAIWVSASNTFYDDSPPTDGGN